ncbi:nucleoside-diphosphate-sugar epimerase [Bradyrhizobium sp. GM0.4]
MHVVGVGAGAGSDGDQRIAAERPFGNVRDVEDLMRDTGFAPSTPIAHGIRNFVAWYRNDLKV